ncbi:transposable element Tcb2 transposase [Trichonephila clavipes]|uniref:Transposable element Tcb2 transposase n=1 Tax=Trichonephila clavipes TaxID=2585209 RepID=A0A8X6RA10_TRICX|nr:transposable element Tcb2 transposase [Trichonephila clavipes]
MAYKARAEVDMPLHRFRRQYECLSQFYRGRIIGMIEAGWSARRVARQLGRADYVLRRCWDQWILAMSFTRRPGSRHPRQNSRREDRYIVRNTRVHPTASSSTTQAQVAPSLGAHVSSRTIQRCLAERYLESRCSIRVLHLTPTFEWYHARGNWTAEEWIQVVFSDESRFNLSSDDNRVLAWRSRGECLNPVFALQRYTAQTGDVIVWGAFTYNSHP